MPQTHVPIALTIAGSDSSGGAGIQADLKTFSAFGVYGASVITALTAQNTRGVSGVHQVPVSFIAAQFEAVMSDLTVTAIKTGMLGDAPTVRTVAACLASHPTIPVVVDPVMVATSGDVLLDPDAIIAVRELLIPRAALITPNLPEAAKLLDASVAASEDAIIEQARALQRLGCTAVLIKGGHGEGGEAVDILFSEDEVHRFVRARIATKNSHGTGCTLSAAIAAGLAEGKSLRTAVEDAKEYVWQALVSGASRDIGTGHGPVDHHFGLRNPRQRG